MKLSTFLGFFCSVVLGTEVGWYVRVNVHVVHPYSSIDTTAAWKKLCFILSVRFNFHMTDCLSIAVHAFASRVSMSVSVDKTLLPREKDGKIIRMIINFIDFFYG